MKFLSGFYFHTSLNRTEYSQHRNIAENHVFNILEMFVFVKAFGKRWYRIIKYLLTGLLGPYLEIRSPHFYGRKLGPSKKIRLLISSYGRSDPVSKE